MCSNINKQELMICLENLNMKLYNIGTVAEIAIYGGGVMCLALGSPIEFKMRHIFTSENTLNRV